MTTQVLSAFEKATVKWFGDFAKVVGLKLEKIGDYTFGIKSSTFLLRINGSTGHRRDHLDVGIILIPGDRPQEGTALANVMEFYGDRLVLPSDLSTPEAIDAEIKRLAALAEKYAAPLLRGSSGDWNRIKIFVEQKLLTGIGRHKYHFPPNVHEEWPVEDDEQPGKPG